MTKTPIVLFVYNRPLHTRQTVEALGKNDLASESDLVIYSDGPKTVQDVGKINEVREYLRQISGFKSVRIHKKSETQLTLRMLKCGMQVYYCAEMCVDHAIRPDKLKLRWLLYSNFANG